MKRFLLALINVLLVAVPHLQGEGKPDANSWQTYVDNTYKLTLRFPAEWKRDPLYSDRPYFGIPAQPQTVSRGFFQLLAEDNKGGDVEQDCKDLAAHVLRPFGGHPTIQPLKIDGQTACVVWPSNDQGAPWDAAVLVRYPDPVEIGGDLYNVLYLDADKDYILQIAATIRFIRHASSGAPFLLEVTPQSGELGAATWKTGGVLRLVLALKNTSPQTIHLTVGDPSTEYHTTLKKLPSGETVSIVEELATASAISPHGLKTLEPQVSYSDAIGIRCPDEEKPSSYSLQVERTLPAEFGKGIVVSNTIRVTAR